MGELVITDHDLGLGVIDEHITSGILSEGIRLTDYTSTITIVCKISCWFNVPEIIASLEPTNEDIVVIVIGNGMSRKHPDYSMDETEKKKIKDRSNFQNSVTMVVKASPTRSLNVKLFANGTLQVTGCRVAEELQTMVNNVVRRLLSAATYPHQYIVINPSQQFLNGEEPIHSIPFIPQVPSLVSCKPVNIILDFKLKYTINLNKLHKELTDQKYLSDYNQDRHPAVHIEYTGHGKTKLATIMVFASGSTKVQSGDPQNIHDAVMFIARFAKDHCSTREPKKICEQTSSSKSEKQKSSLDEVIEEDPWLLDD